MLLLIDNYDSFTYNLAHYLEALDVEVKVIRNDEWTLSDINQAKPSHIVISPGPCTPNESGISIEVIQQMSQDIPILGVCLGHQSIAQAFGAAVIKAPMAMHGKTSIIDVLTSHPMFNNTPSQFEVTRYHSLMIQANTLPNSFQITATTADKTQDIIMAIAHNTLPLWGVQYHPESIMSEYGYQLLENFLNT